MPKDESKVSKKRGRQEEGASTDEVAQSKNVLSATAVSDSISGQAVSTELESEAVSFEEALRELENVVGTLENGGVPLETSLQMLKRGLELADRCERVLTDAELTLEKLVLTDEGELISEELEAE